MWIHQLVFQLSTTRPRVVLSNVSISIGPSLIGRPGQKAGNVQNRLWGLVLINRGTKIGSPIEPSNAYLFRIIQNFNPAILILWNHV